MNHLFEIAIVERNTLTCLALKAILEKIIPAAAIYTFSSYEELMDDTSEMFAHYFVSAQIYINHASFFLQRKMKTFVLTLGEKQPSLRGIHTIDLHQNEETIVKDILRLYKYGHQHSSPLPKEKRNTDPTLLTKREIEVLILLAKGYINKEIADKLHISITTVISHRKNIQEKLGIKSVSGLTIYAVINGYVGANEI
ncbi:LuxR C-terminal-related transcriptional regulator [Phocaeicola abscessus]|mgnify:CR=1 FL=1|uniref:response regulator transcription factor n=1 Tax=Phocaeicola abscessus TaxID=555313 RepID=UPI0028EE48C8|nr:LuxR C-terminal-related transcriptional regulator [Phocaeicola abscessus]